MMSNSVPLHSARYMFLSTCRLCIVMGPGGAVEGRGRSEAAMHFCARWCHCAFVDQRLGAIHAGIAVDADDAELRRLVAELRDSTPP